jgi:hypothetical protein
MPRTTEDLFLYHSRMARKYKQLLIDWWKDVKKTNLHQSEKDYLISFFDWYILEDALKSKEAQMVRLRAKYIHHMKQKWYTHQRIWDLLWKHHASITYILETYNTDGTRKEKTKYKGRPR